MSKPKFDFAVGGQALIEGVMMRSRNYIAMAVRKQDGSIKIHDWPFLSLIHRWSWLNIPFVRGVINMIEMMIVGMKAMNISAEEAVETEEDIIEKRKIAETIDSHKTEFWKELWAMALFAVNIVLAIALALLLFKFVPLYTTEFLRDNFIAIQQSHILYNVIDGLLKLSIFILYIAGIGLIPSIGRVFEYHGAEHKAVFSYEHDNDLNDIKAAQAETRFHPRCGTSFIFIVIVISIVVYSFFPRQPDFWIQFASRVAILPLIAGIAYEALKLSAKHQKNRLVGLMVKPGLWFQRLTTREPKEDQLEVALEALKRTLTLEKSKDEYAG